MLLELEPLLVQRLKDELGARVREVQTAPDVATMVAAKQVPVCPAVLVIFGRHRVLEAQVAGDARLEVLWQTVVVVRNASQAPGGAAARADVAPLLRGVHAALAGWCPPGGYTPLVPATPLDEPGQWAGAYCLALGWRTSFVWRAQAGAGGSPFWP